VKGKRPGTKAWSGVGEGWGGLKPKRRGDKGGGDFRTSEGEGHVGGGVRTPVTLRMLMPTKKITTPQPSKIRQKMPQKFVPHKMWQNYNTVPYNAAVGRRIAQCADSVQDMRAAKGSRRGESSGSQTTAQLPVGMEAGAGSDTRRGNSHCKGMFNAEGHGRMGRITEWAPSGETLTTKPMRGREAASNPGFGAAGVTGVPRPRSRHP